MSPQPFFDPQDSIRQRGSKIGCFWHIHRTHLGSTIPIRKSEVYSDQKNITDLMLEHGPTSPLYTPAWNKKEQKTGTKIQILSKLRAIMIHKIVFWRTYHRVTPRPRRTKLESSVLTNISAERLEELLKGVRQS